MSDFEPKGEYEYNGDAWYYKGYEYHRGDLVPMPEDLDDPGRKHVEQLVEEGTLVEPGFAQKLRDEQAQAEDDAEQARVEQIERDDAEAHRRVAAEQRRLHGDPKADEADDGTARATVGNEGSSSSKPAPKPGPRRTTASK